MDGAGSVGCRGLTIIESVGTERVGVVIKGGGRCCCAGGAELSRNCTLSMQQHI